MPVDITDIRIFRIIGSGRVKAYANVTLGDEFAVHGVRVMERDDGTLRVGMPRQRSASDGTWRDVFHPITSARERLPKAVLEAYEKFIGEGGEKAPETEEAQKVEEEEDVEEEETRSPGGGIEEEKAGR
jgi:stage V sporulation protein G